MRERSSTTASTRSVAFIGGAAMAVISLIGWYVARDTNPDTVASVDAQSEVSTGTTVPAATTTSTMLATTTSTSSTSTTTTLLDPSTLAGHHVGAIPEDETVKCPQAKDVPIVGTLIDVPGYENRPTSLQAAADTSGPLLVILHGQHGCIQNVQSRSDLDVIGTAAGMNVLWLSGAPLPTRSWNTNGRCCEPASTNGVDDIAYFEAAIAAAKGTGLTPRKVLLVGVSNGAGMAVAAGCKRPDLFDAVVSVAGWAPAACKSADVSLLTFGGSEDVKLGSRTAAVIANMWRTDVRQCPNEPTVEVNDAATITTWRGCTDGDIVRLVQIEGVPHVWPKFTYYDMDDDIIRFALGYLD